RNSSSSATTRSPWSSPNSWSASPCRNPASRAWWRSISTRRCASGRSSPRSGHAPMTDLQLGLLAIGVLAVIAVVVYNRWQERAARRDAEQAFASAHTDVLLDERREPALAPRREPPPEPRRSAPAPARVLPAEGVDYVI